MDRQAIIEILRPLGEQPRTLDNWLDYSVYGFSAEDAPVLVDLAVDKAGEFQGEENEDSWIPLHAWRALKHLMPAGLDELIAEFDVFLDDMWADNEIPHVVAEAGAVAVEPLFAIAQDDGRDLGARSLALTALQRTAIRFPELRAQVVDGMVAMLDEYDAKDTWLGGIIVSELVDLEAVEAIDAIRAAFAKERVDLSITGDLEDVEMELGLRDERTTPRPRYGVFRDGNKPQPPSLAPVAARVTFDELGERIMQFIDYYGSQDALGNVSALDGFFTAIGCAPQIIPPSVWMGAFWGGDELQPAWPDLQSAQVFMELLMRFNNFVMASLQDIEAFEPAFDVFEHGEGGDTVTVFGGWCDGFMRGARLWLPLTPGASDVSQFVETIAEMSGLEGVMRTLDYTSRQMELQERAIKIAVEGIYRINRHTANQPVQHAPKVGRNDPCPCGSGKKYKKCCLH